MNGDKFSFDDSRMIKETIDLLLKLDEISTHEIQVLGRINNLLIKPYPTTSSGVNIRLEELSKARVRITRILLRVNYRIIEFNKELDSKYYRQFYDGKKFSSKATNAEVKAKIEKETDYRDKIEKRDKLEEMAKFLAGMIKDVDSIKSDMDHLSYDVRRKDS